jgi:polyisoprenoid-binding protein YceI
MLRRPLVIGLAAFAAFVVLAGAGAYAYLFSGLHAAPAALGLAALDPNAARSTTSTDRLAGHWTVMAGSQAGYRVKEQLAGQTLKHEAVARTSAVTGELTVRPSSSGVQVIGLRFVAQLSDLQSVDTVAGHNVTNRDRNVSRTLAVQQYPEAVFQASTLSLPARVAQGQTVTVRVPGTLTVHGVTRPVSAAVQVRMAGGQVQAAGSTDIDMTQFGVTPPQIAFAQSDAQVTVDFELVLTKA